ncbi:MAG: BREX-1 system adenine-specific DNA-methyltransferase PglX, partial [Acidobacteria bacterium]|nr:BREX-1 system adenine-specific DNA-methyltransferase PglX [Acidobacteriota bacterium]
HIAVGEAYPAGGEAGNRTMLDEMLAAGLTPTVETDYERWKPLHWILAVPDVMEKGGFDAVIGNPPFLGGKKVSPAAGSNLREWLVNVLADRIKGNADLVAYFLLRAASLTTARGNLGLIATNSLAQGQTREVGLDRLEAAGFTITRAIQSRPWPVATANLEYAAVWGTRGPIAEGVARIADDIVVERISTLLEPGSQVDGKPARLAENAGIAFQGCIVLGNGFILDSDQAAEWIDADPTNAEVLFPYLGGEDLNSRPDASASRYIIDFGERSEAEARRYRIPWAHVEQHVRPQRTKKDVVKYPRMVHEWWKFWNSRPAMRKAISGLEEVLATTRVSDVGLPARVSAGKVYSERLAVFASGSFVLQSVLSSSLHISWLIKYGTTHESRLTYGPTSVFETFPRPEPTGRLAKTGVTLNANRREIMSRRDLGLTKLYNLVNDPATTDSADPDVARLRKIHVELDEALISAYGWDDVPLKHGFHTYRQMRRWTVSPAARVEILDRLLEENHRRAAAQGEAPPPVEAEDDTEDAVREDW